MTQLDFLTVYRSILQDEVVRAYLAVHEAFSASDEVFAARFVSAYGTFVHLLLQRRGDLALGKHLMELVLADDNAFTRGASAPEVTAAAEADMAVLRDVGRGSPRQLLDAAYGRITDVRERALLRAMPVFSCDLPEWELTVSYLTDFHAKHGFGLFAANHFFLWEGALRPVTDFDPITFADLVGYEAQIQTVRRNTEQFLAGYRASNMLLYGDRGVGKSSTVKALVNEYCGQGLRLVELPVSRVSEIGRVVEAVREAGNLKFILFLDDFSISSRSREYGALKSMLEGSVQKQPDNVLVYATGNRRHLMQETASGEPEGVRSADAVQERMSLSDRFPVTVTYLALTQEEYLDTVFTMARREGLRAGADELRREAVAFSMRYNGMSPRTAVHFVARKKYEEAMAQLSLEQAGM